MIFSYAFQPKKIFGPLGVILKISTWGHKTSKIPYGDQLFLSELLAQFYILYKEMHYHSKNYFQGVLSPLQISHNRLCVMICSGWYLHEKCQRIENLTNFCILIWGSYWEYQTSAIQIEKTCCGSYSAIHVNVFICYKLVH